MCTKWCITCQTGLVDNLPCHTAAPCLALVLRVRAALLEGYTPWMANLVCSIKCVSEFGSNTTPIVPGESIVARACSRFVHDRAGALRVARKITPCGVAGFDKGITIACIPRLAWRDFAPQRGLRTKREQALGATLYPETKKPGISRLLWSCWLMDILKKPFIVTPAKAGVQGVRRF